MAVNIRRVLYAVWFLTLCAGACHADITIEHAFCRGGQVFIHWSDPGTTYDHYRVYRSTLLIDSTTFDQAQLIADNVPVHSAKDLAATTIAARKGQADPNVGLRIDDLAAPLDPDDDLYVYTTQDAGSFFYCVKGVDADGVEQGDVIPGMNSLVDPIDISPGEPEPILDEQGNVSVNDWTYPYYTYTWYRRSNECSYDGAPTKLTVTLPSTNYYKSQWQTMLYLHYHGGTNAVMPWWNTIVISPCDVNNFLPSSYSWWYGYADTYPDFTNATVVNYSENMLLDMLAWANKNFPVDTNRVFLNGGSMGGTGSISFGLRHSELIAGIMAQVPQVNPGLPGIGWSQDELETIWGPVSSNIRTNDGAGVWDRQNMTAYVKDHLEDLPYLKVQNSKNDAVLMWFQIPDFYKTLNASRHGFIAAWGQGGHNNSSTGLPSEYLNFDIMSKISLNQSYVVISNSSVSNDPGNGDPASGDPIGQMNAGYNWSILTDTPQEWSANISYYQAKEVRADISARRIQFFNFHAGDPLVYSLTDVATGKIIQWGRVDAERERFFVIPNLPFNGTQRKLSVWKSSNQTFSDVIEAEEYSPVDIDAVVVTAVFNDICYGQSPNYVPAIGILGASGLKVGSLIHLQGTKAMAGLLPAVQVSSPNVASYGTVDVKPVGVSRPFPQSQNPSITNGLLVKVWGIVQSVDGALFTIDSGAGVMLVYGITGVPPDPGSVVVVTGIADTTVPGIRVRSPQDVQIIQ